MSAFSVAVSKVGRNLGLAGQRVAKAGGHAVDAAKEGFIAADKAILATKAAYGDTYWGAIKGVAKAHPVSATAAGVGLVAGTAYVGSQVFGSHTDRVMRERETGAEIRR